MADPSLLDFGQMMNSMVNMGQLREYQRHNDIAEQNSIATMGQLDLKKQEFALDQQKLDLQKKQIQQNGYFRAYDEIQKQKEDPIYNLLPVEQKVNLADLQGRLLAQSAGVPYDPPDRNELRGALQERDDLNNAMRQHLADPSNEGYRVEAYGRLAKYVAASPKDGLKLLEGLDKLGSLDEKGKELKLKIEVNQAKLDKLNTQAGAIRMQQGIYTEHLGAINQTASIPLKKDYQPHFQAVMAMDRPEAQAAYLNLHSEFKGPFLAEINQRKEAMGFKDSQILKELGVAGEPGVISALNQAIDARRDAVSAAQQATGQASPEAEAELAHLISVRDARMKEADWLSDPFNKEKYRVLNGTQQTLRIGVSSLSRQLSGIQSERLAFDQMRFDAKAHTEEATGYAQGQFLDYLNQGKDENQAAALAQKDTAQKFPGVTPDITKLKNFKSASDYTREYDNKVMQAQAELAENGDYKQAGPIAKKYGVKVTDMINAVKDPNKPLIDQTTKTKLTVEEAGKASMMYNALDNIDRISHAITNKDGSINRGLVFSSEAFGGLPWTEGKNINSMVDDAVSAKLRAETGAAANKDEVINIARRFKPTSTDSDETIKSKMKRFRSYIKDTIDLFDPEGTLRKRTDRASIQELPRPDTSAAGASAPPEAAPKQPATAKEWLDEWKKSF